MNIFIYIYIFIYILFCSCYFLFFKYSFFMKKNIEIQTNRYEYTINKDVQTDSKIYNDISIQTIDKVINNVFTQTDGINSCDKIIIKKK